MLVRRETKTGSNDFNVVYRPLKVSEIIGQEANCKMVNKWFKEDSAPHSFLFTGDPGCGKTTMARIIALGLNCERPTKSKEACLKCQTCLSIINHSSIDMVEINVGSHGTKGDVTSIVRDLPGAPFSSNFKIVIFDEAQELTSASQNLLLKIIEDGYKHVYFIFCTNEPQKLKDAFTGGRVTRMHFDRLNTKLLLELLKNVAEFEGMSYKETILLYLAEEAKGVPRDCLPWLKQVNDEGSWTLEAVKEIIGILIDEEHPQIIDLCNELLKGEWKKAFKMYEKINLPAENIRGAMAGYFIWRMKRAKNLGHARQLSDMVDCIIEPIYDPGKLGNHKMINAMFKIVSIVKGRRA